MIAVNLLIESIGVLAIGVLLGLYWFGSWLQGDAPQKSVRLGHLVLSAGLVVSGLIYLVGSTAGTVSQAVLDSSLPARLPTRPAVMYASHGSTPTPVAASTITMGPSPERTSYPTIETPTATYSPEVPIVPPAPVSILATETPVPTARPAVTPTPMCRDKNLRITYPPRGKTLSDNPIKIQGAVFGAEGTVYSQIIVEAMISQAEPYNGVHPGWPISVTVNLDPTGGSDFEGLLAEWDWQNMDPERSQGLEGNKVWLRLRAKKPDGNADVLSDECLVWIILERPQGGTR